MRRLLLCLGIVALVLQAGAGTAQAAERPFKVAASAPLGFDLFFPGTVVGTEIGQGSFTITPLGMTAVPPWGGFVWCGTLSARFEMMASTGDKIDVDMLALSCQTALQAPPFSGPISGVYQIVGGTGRFMHATGSGFVTGTFEVLTFTEGSLTLSFEGTISY